MIDEALFKAVMLLSIICIIYVYVYVQVKKCKMAKQNKSEKERKLGGTVKPVDYYYVACKKTL